MSSPGSRDPMGIRKALLRISRGVGYSLGDLGLSSKDTTRNYNYSARVTNMKRIFLAVVLLGGVNAAHASGIVNPEVTGNKLQATVSIAGIYEAALTIEFEDAVGLTVDNLGMSADLISVTNSSLINRLPEPSLIGIAGGFPVRISIDPPASGGFSFSGMASVELYTHNLNYDPAVPLRLFSAETGGEFRDITELVTGGSHRTRGSKGDWSEFLIVLDGRSTNSVIQTKFDRVNDLLNTYQGDLPSTLYATLDGLLVDAENAFDNGDIAQAIDHVEQFSEVVLDGAGSGEVPNVWRSARDIDNVAGQLRAGASTLRFSLTLAANQL